MHLILWGLGHEQKWHQGLLPPKIFEEFLVLLFLIISQLAVDRPYRLPLQLWYPPTIQPNTAINKHPTVLTQNQQKTDKVPHYWRIAERQLIIDYNGC